MAWKNSCAAVTFALSIGARRELGEVVVEDAVAGRQPLVAGLAALGGAVAVEARVADLGEVHVELAAAAAVAVGDRRAVAVLLDFLLPDLVHQPEHLVDPGLARGRVLGRGDPVDAEVALALLLRRHEVAVVVRVAHAVGGSREDAVGHLPVGRGQVVERGEQVAHHRGGVAVLPDLPPRRRRCDPHRPWCRRTAPSPGPAPRWHARCRWSRRSSQRGVRSGRPCLPLVGRGHHGRGQGEGQAQATRVGGERTAHVSCLLIEGARGAEGVEAARDPVGPGHSLVG